MDYFAYGSNMNLLHLHEWLRRFGVEPEGVSDSRRVILRDHRLRTNYLTSSSFGAANIEASAGDAVEGILLVISPEARQALRAKEGWPRRYEEIGVDVVVPESRRTIRAVTYRVTTAHRLSIDVPVSPRYRALILDGARAARLSRAYQSKLRAILETPTMLDHVSQLACRDREETDEDDSAGRRCA